jgi:multifunctional methyltransferase subunit TRM112
VENINDLVSFRYAECYHDLEFSPALLEDDNILRVLHHLLFDMHLTEGELVCPESGQRFPVTNGIPNMM